MICHLDRYQRMWYGLRMTTNTTSEHDTVDREIKIDQGVPQPPSIHEYARAFKSMDLGDSFIADSAEASSVSEAAMLTGSKILRRAAGPKTFRVWLTGRYTTPEDYFLDSVRTWAIAHPSLTWEGKAADLRRVVGSTMDVRKFGRHLSTLGSDGRVGVSVISVDAKRGNKYRLDLMVLREGRQE